MHWVGVLIFTLSACTSITFQSRGLIPVFITPKDQHNTFVKTSGQKEFYLWGLIGPDTIVEVDRELIDQGLASAANISLYEYQTFGSFCKSLLSLGLYIPKPYKMTAFGLKSDNDVRILKRKAFQQGDGN